MSKGIYVQVFILGHLELPPIASLLWSKWEIPSWAPSFEQLLTSWWCSLRRYRTPKTWSLAGRSTWVGTCLESLVSSHVQFSSFLILMLHIQGLFSNKQRGEWSAWSSLGLFPVPCEYVNRAQNHHGDYEGERLEGQEELKSEAPGHSNQNARYEEAGGTPLVLLEVEEYPPLHQINHLFNLEFLIHLLCITSAISATFWALH